MTPLEKSIEHWERLASGNRLLNESATSIDCALCNIYLSKENTCNGCPIKEKTGRSYCFDTPFDIIRNMDRISLIDYNSKEFKEAAKKELEFLKSLLPK